MAYIEGHARAQALLLPASVEDYVSADNPVRFIDAFVDDLDLGDAGFLRSRPKATGRPGFDPGDMLKLYLSGYLNRVRSSRRLEAEAVRNLEVICPLRGLRPDFKTIADFRRDNRSAFKAVFRPFAYNSLSPQCRSDSEATSCDRQNREHKLWLCNLVKMQISTIEIADIPEPSPIPHSHGSLRPNHESIVCKFAKHAVHMDGR
jgi:transposase